MRETWQVYTHTTDKDDGLDTLSKHGDEGQEEQSPLPVPRLLPGPGSILGLLILQQSGRSDLVVEGLSELDPPFNSAAVHLEES